MNSQLLTRILVPIANEDDVRATSKAIKHHVDIGVELYAIHVIEKGAGAPDKAPLEARQKQAQAIFDVLENEFAETDYELTTEVRYARSVVNEIILAAEEHDATSIAFTPRLGSRVAKFLSGNKTRKLVTTNHVPVIVLPNDGETV